MRTAVVVRRICAALSNNGNIARSDLNVARALTCLAPDTEFGRVRPGDGNFSLTDGTPDRGAKLSVVFRDDARLAGQVLRIVAEGY